MNTHEDVRKDMKKFEDLGKAFFSLLAEANVVFSILDKVIDETLAKKNKINPSWWCA